MKDINIFIDAVKANYSEVSTFLDLAKNYQNSEANYLYDVSPEMAAFLDVASNEKVVYSLAYLYIDIVKDTIDIQGTSYGLSVSTDTNSKAIFITVTNYIRLSVSKGGLKYFKDITIDFLKELEKVYITNGYNLENTNISKNIFTELVKDNLDLVGGFLFLSQGFEKSNALNYVDFSKGLEIFLEDAERYEIINKLVSCYILHVADKDLVNFHEKCYIGTKSQKSQYLFHAFSNTISSVMSVEVLDKQLKLMQVDFINIIDKEYKDILKTTNISINDIEEVHKYSSFREYEQYFKYAHLPENLQTYSKYFADTFKAIYFGKNDNAKKSSFYTLAGIVYGTEVTDKGNGQKELAIKKTDDAFRNFLTLVQYKEKGELYDTNMKIVLQSLLEAKDCLVRAVL